MATKFKATSGKKLIAALEHTGWAITTDGEFLTATRGDESHDLTFGRDDILRASLVELWCRWLHLRPEDIE